MSICFSSGGNFGTFYNDGKDGVLVGILYQLKCDFNINIFFHRRYV